MSTKTSENITEIFSLLEDKTIKKDIDMANFIISLMEDCLKEDKDLTEEERKAIENALIEMKSIKESLSPKEYV